MIGRAWSVKIRRKTPFGNETELLLFESGTAYEYAMLPPRYPMPATGVNALLALPLDIMPIWHKALWLQYQT